MCKKKWCAHRHIGLYVHRIFLEGYPRNLMLNASMEKTGLERWVEIYFLPPNCFCTVKFLLAMYTNHFSKNNLNGNAFYFFNQLIKVLLLVGSLPNEID